MAGVGALTGKLCIVTGATSGIGKATAIQMVKEGAKVVGVGRNKDALEELKSHGVFPVEGDVTESGSCQRIIAEAVAALGGLTTLVNNAGVLKGGAVGQQEPATMVEVLQYNMGPNTVALYEMMEHAVPHLRQAGKDCGPSIVNVTSVNGQHAFAGCAAYCASKAAAEMLTKCAAVDLAKDGIRVNAVAPGVVVTELQKRGGFSDEAYEAFLKRSIEVTHPIAASRGKCGEPSEVADLVVFLASDKAGFITGESVRIDGGRFCLGAR